MASKQIVGCYCGRLPAKKAWCLRSGSWATVITACVPTVLRRLIWLRPLV